MNKIIENITSDVEREFYGSKNISFYKITISGPADGESAFKECNDIDVHQSTFKLRYPFWHNTNCFIAECKFSSSSRAAFWYCKNISFNMVKLHGIKAIRECSNVSLYSCDVKSDEFAWRVDSISLNKVHFVGYYAFFECKDVNVDATDFKGKYSFQYVDKGLVQNSILDTKDAFWHSKNVTVKNCLVKGEYLGWYSENLTLINCKISGTQPLCYCKGLKLIDCTMESCDLSFENSEVTATINGNVDSIKNPLKGQIIIKGTTNYIKDENDRSKGRFELVCE